MERTDYDPLLWEQDQDSGQPSVFAQHLERTPEEIIYDESFKNLLSTRYFLAWILKGCVWEFKAVSVSDIAEIYIEGDPQVSNTPVHPGQKGERIHGLDTADKSRDERTTLYDILFYATLPGSAEKIGLFINIEAQNRYNPGYPLTKRGIYYCSRLLSAQFGRDFADGQYDKLKKVYSIWICTNAPDSRKNTVTLYELAERQLLGQAEEKRENYDLLSLVMICFNNKRPEVFGETTMTGDDPTDMLRLLRMLLSADLSPSQKHQMIMDDYHIPMTQQIREEVYRMCNVSQGIREQGIEQGLKQGIEQGFKQGMEQGLKQGIRQGIQQGIQQGVEQGIQQGVEKGIKQGMEQGRNLEKAEMVLTMLRKKYPVQMILDCTGYPMEKIQSMAEEHHIPVVYGN